MTPRLLSAVSMAFLVALTSVAVGQEKNEIAGIIGPTVVSDQGVTGVVAPDTNLHTGNGITLEANYGRRLLNIGIVVLIFDVPFVVNLG